MTHAKAVGTERHIHHLFAGRLVAENGQIKLLREPLNVVVAVQALNPKGAAGLPPPSDEIFSVSHRLPQAGKGMTMTEPSAMRLEMESFLTSGIPTVTPNPPAGEKRRFFSPISSTLTLRQAGCGTRRHLHDRRPERRPRRLGEGQREEPDDDLHHARRRRPPGARSPQRDLAHGIEADVPAVWAGSEQPNRHAVGMPSLLSAIFIEQISELFLGSGERGPTH